MMMMMMINVVYISFSVYGKWFFVFVEILVFVDSVELYFFLNFILYR